jgi:hypothetical protein
MRRNSDELRRELERKAATGDIAAKARLYAEELRSGVVTREQLLARAVATDPRVFRSITADEAARQVVVAPLLDELAAGRVTKMDLLNRAARGDDLARLALNLDRGQVSLLLSVGGFGTQVRTAAEGETALRAFFRGLGFQHDTRGAGLVSPPDPDGKMMKIAFKPKTIEIFRGRRGAWGRATTRSKIDEANSLLAEASGEEAQQKLREKKAADAEKAVVRRAKVARQKDALRATAMLISQDLTPEQRREFMFGDDSLSLTMRGLRMLPAVEAELDPEATPEKIDAGLSVDTPPIFLDSHNKGDKDWPTSHEWLDPTTGLKIEMRRRRGDKGIAILIGNVPVDPLSGGVDARRMAEAMFLSAEDDEGVEVASGYVGLSGAISKGMYSDSPAIPFVYMFQSRDMDLLRRIFRSFCRIIHAYGFSEFAAVGTDDEDRAELQQLVDAGELVIVARDRSQILLRCNAALAGAPGDTRDVPFEDPRQLKLFNRRRRNGGQKDSEEEVRLLINELEAARASSLKTMSLGMDFIRTRPEWRELTSPQYHDALVRVAKQRGGVGNMNEHAREFYAEAIIESSQVRHVGTLGYDLSSDRRYRVSPDDEIILENPETPEQRRRRRASLQSAGLCVECGDPVWRDGARYCDEHREQHRLLTARLREERDAAGLCRRCGKRRAIQTTKLCRACAEVDRSTSRSRYTRLVAKGLCGHCGQETRGGKAMCDDCMAERAARQEKTARSRARAGLCQKCGRERPLPGSTRCRRCAANQKEHSRKHYESVVARGVCSQCRERKAEKGRRKCGRCLKKDRDAARRRRA